ETPTPAGSGGGRRRGLLIGGGIAALAVVGVGAWAAAQYFNTGAQPAEALPASTVGYASIDLDPSGAQKIEALRTLNKFPAFKELTSAAGSAGIATMYAAPEAGKYFGDAMGGMSGLAGDVEQGLTGTDSLGELSDAAPTGTSPMSNFKGMAATVRFDDGALE